MEIQNKIKEILEDIEPNVWKPTNKDDFLDGVLVEKRQDVGTNKSNAYYIETKPHNVVMVWGSTILDDRLSLVSIGEKIRITFKGTEESKRGNDLKLYKVQRYVLRDDTNKNKLDSNKLSKSINSDEDVIKDE